jgi:hypothetical protein
MDGHRRQQLHRRAVIGHTAARRVLAALVVGDAVLAGALVGLVMRNTDPAERPADAVTATTSVPPPPSVPASVIDAPVAIDASPPSSAAPTPTTLLPQPSTSAPRAAPTTASAAPREAPPATVATTAVPTTVPVSTTVPPG